MVHLMSAVPWEVSIMVGVGLELGLNLKEVLSLWKRAWHSPVLIQASRIDLFEEGTCPSRSPVMSVFTTKIEWQQSLFPPPPHHTHQ